MTTDKLPPSGTQSAVGNGEILDNISTVYRWLRILWYYHIKYDINDFSCYCLLYLHDFVMRCGATYFCFDSNESSLSHTTKCYRMPVDTVLRTAQATLCQRPGKRTLPAAALPFQEEITVSWIINENKLANIKYWKGNVCMLTITTASEALTCLKERSCQPNASPPPYLPGISQHEEEQGVLPPCFKHCSDQ